ncbi:hypothetical protein [Treponema zioleckii]|uniref:hypothetical protein n=1 Tax=Treponema zioleckii TaxID=331680 RepID=UPI0030EB4895
MSFIHLLQAGAEGNAAQPSILMTIAPFVIILGIFYLFIIRPQIKNRKKPKK